MSLEDSKGLRDIIKINGKYRVYWHCGVSQRICDRIEKERACQWSGIAAVL